MKREIIQLIVRFITTVILLFYVYRETGWVTVFCLFLLFFGVEVNTFLIRKIMQKLTMRLFRREPEIGLDCLVGVSRQTERIRWEFVTI